jgi:hypothetical protein
VTKKENEQEYTVKRRWPHNGNIYTPGEKVSMHPRQAKYLIGTYLEDSAKPAAKTKSVAKKTAEVKDNA